jgi:predicted amidohydrolase
VQQRKIPVASIQTLAHDRADFDTVWPRLVALVDEAGRRGAKLIILPEGTVPGYVLGTQPVSEAQLEHASDALADCARRHGATIVYGSAKKAGAAILNAAIVIGPNGREIGYAAKRFLWHFDRLWFAPGATLEPIDTPVGRLGLLVCADGRIPSIAATLVERGAEILVMPTAWVTSGRDPGALENIQADLMVNVRARENGVPFAAANKAGVELASVAYCGKSALVDSSGAFVARAGERGEEILFAELELGAPAPRPRSRAPSVAAHALAAPVERARIAFTPVTEPAEFARLSALALQADAAATLGAADAACEPDRDRPIEIAGVRAAAVAWETLRSPRGLVAARLAGIDLFVCRALGEAAWHAPFARTRAAELRAYVVVFDEDAQRAFAVDPDGAIVAGTFDGYRMAAFTYERSRAAATLVAPATDVLAGLREAEEIRRRTLGNEALV